tara:strand:+ start:2056 stop:2226 length:171 start_codon:yes stop_codon:yes gene_type:complete
MMAKILETTLPFATETYDPQTMQLILTILQRSLDDVILPDEISGEDEMSGISWFLS